MKILSTLLALLVVVVIAACGEDSDASSAAMEKEDAAMVKEDDAMAKEDDAMAKDEDAMAKEDDAMAKASATGTGIVVRDSEFGRMLFNTKRQAIYIFQRDARNRSNCYGECARLWPPVYTKGKPRALTGVRKALLGTTKRRNGRLQVTYNGKPLYYYHNEGPGEVRCHNVNLNGGLWWVIGPNGKRRP